MRKTFLIFLFFILAAVSQFYANEADEIKTVINSIEISEAFLYDSLAVFLINKKDVVKNSSYTLLDEALKKKMLEITEINGGNVPKVNITNLSDKMIYIMGGEIITGCKQDRIIARDVLIAPKRKNLIVPVYCVEQGRWTHKSKNFTTKENLGTSKLRAEAQKNEGGSQSKIWNEISEYFNKNDARSSSNAYQDIYDDKKVNDKIEKIEKELKKIEIKNENCIGVLITYGDKIISLDIFADNYLLSNLWDKIIKSTALSSITEKSKGSFSINDAKNFINKLDSKHYENKDAIDMGKEYSLNDNKINANALTHENRLIHLAAFLEEPEKTSKKEDQRIRVYNSQGRIIN
ncbi:MAG: hypothetical protein JXB50_15620 [Spirochaetes bacterium]|nr:hypothetical protein [Spirochaetota bacterium]